MMRLGIEPTIRRSYGVVGGYVSSVDRFRAPLDSFTGDSKDWVLDSETRFWLRRLGKVNVGGTNGILEVSASMRSRQMFEIASRRYTDGYPTHAVQYTNDFPGDGVRYRGQLYFRDTLGSLNRVVGSFGTTPTTHKSTSFVVAFSDANGQPNATAETQFHLKDGTAARSYLAAGTRRSVSHGNRRYFPSLYAMPHQWDGGQEPQTMTGLGTIERVFWWGHTVPVRFPDIAAGAQDEKGSWKDTDSFFYAVSFIMEDGSVSPPCLPRKPNATLATGLGLVNPLVMGGTGITFSSVALTNIARGVAGCVGRILWRSRKETKKVPVNPRDLLVWEVLWNNVQTSLTSFKGDDSELVADALRLRFDLMWCPRGRYAFQFDGRFAVCYCLPNPGRILLAPIVKADGTSIVGDDDTLPAEAYVAYYDGTNLVLKQDATATNIAVAGKTIEDLVDSINALPGGAGTAGKWGAQLIPSVDPDMLASNLLQVAAGDACKAYNTAWPAVLYESASHSRANIGASKRRVYWTIGDPAMPHNAPLNFSSRFQNYREAPEEAGQSMGGGGLFDGAILVYANGHALLRNVRGGKTGLDEDYRHEYFPLDGCVAPGTVVQGNGWVAWLTADGFVARDASRRINLSGALFNPDADPDSRGNLEYEIGQAIAAAAQDNDGARCEAALVGKAIHLTYRSSGSATRQDRRIVYDFSASQVSEGIDELLRSDGTLWGWSCPLSDNVAVVGSVRKSTGRAVYGTNDANAGATDGRVDQIDTGSYDKDQSFVVAGCSWTSGSTTITGIVGSFNSVAVGSGISGHADIPAGATVTAKAADGSSLTISAATTGGPNSATLTFTWREVEPVGYHAVDFCDSLAYKAACRVREIHVKNGTGLTLALSRDIDRNTLATVKALASSGTSHYVRGEFDVPLDLRAPAEMLEFKITDDGSGGRAKWPGLELDVIVLDD